MKRVYVAQNQVDGILMRQRLEAAGIRVVMKVDTVAAPSIPYPSLWVDDADVERATALLAKGEEGQG